MFSGFVMVAIMWGFGGLPKVTHNGYQPTATHSQPMVNPWPMAWVWVWVGMGVGMHLSTCGFTHAIHYGQLHNIKWSETEYIRQICQSILWTMQVCIIRRYWHQSTHWWTSFSPLTYNSLDLLLCTICGSWRTTNITSLPVHFKIVTIVIVQVNPKLVFWKWRTYQLKPQWDIPSL